MLVFQLGRPGKKIFWRVLLKLLSVSFLLKLPPITPEKNLTKSVFEGSLQLLQTFHKYNTFWKYVFILFEFYVEVV